MNTDETDCFISVIVFITLYRFKNVFTYLRVFQKSLYR